ncbi:hypothetical protein [Mycoplana sp. MJR14]|uniref:hypothetical protein n=1 Tax=Mycoplana sp. MJR14 TaxID=3032583 RepID=UPI0023D99A4B|nr:hypothetical protein [Mycoplana sp. MJR14]MDF1632150.1 hypothetical protein [Mycoplana sp. MJR14]
MEKKGLRERPLFRFRNRRRAPAPVAQAASEEAEVVCCQGRARQQGGKRHGIRLAGAVGVEHQAAGGLVVDDAVAGIEGGPALDEGIRTKRAAAGYGSPAVLRRAISQSQ